MVPWIRTPSGPTRKALPVAPRPVRSTTMPSRRRRLRFAAIDRDALPVAVRVEEWRGDGDRGLAGQRRAIRVLHRRSGRSGGEEVLGRDRCAFVARERRELDRATEVDEEDLLGIAGLRHDRREDRAQTLLGIGPDRRGRCGVEQVARFIAHPRQPRDEDDVPRLLVDPAVDRIGLGPGDRVEPVIDGRRQVIGRAHIDDSPDDQDRDRRDDQERSDQARPEAAAERVPASAPGARHLWGYGSVWSSVARSNAAACDA